MLNLIYLVAITAEAMTGALAARRRNLDVFGVLVIAFVTALGGGTVRDIFLGHFPVAWTQHPGYLYLVLSAGLLTTLIAPFLRHLREIFLVLDAMGLMAFTLIGCNVGLTMGYEVPVVMMAGMMTGVFGGVLRDVLCNRVPVVFQRELYASVSLLAGGLFLLLRAAGVDQDVDTAVSFVLGLTLRLIAIWRGWRLPAFEEDEARGVKPQDAQHE
ncbi:putative membrane protein YeiH [Paraburkholderia bannensis]|uniref:Putative membrane protein YeiH n=1 Tax=Paraburkholderia bannensis TaxID=765414 RepID=A0A7W9TYS3_9BURK|nr:MULTISPECIES: trimeric intracellular cation channel family protein [Paraburkholderia]MBB3258163.1 putative membrane protein YeiH [Paraburkholderia sp. WP4_3_2]MBB6103176.1 putative membrane protein YeiH [Paraburkholderia bannensis]